MHTFLVFREGKLVTVVQSIVDNDVHNVDGEALIIDYDYIAVNPQEAEKQIAQWKSEHQ